MSDMNKRRDELARKSVNRDMLELHEADGRERHFKLGWDACLTDLASCAGEFEPELAFHRWTKNQHPIGFAEWQHQQTAAPLLAKIEHLEKDLQDYKAGAAVEARAGDEARAQIQQLEAKLVIAREALHYFRGDDFEVENHIADKANETLRQIDGNAEEAG